MAWTVDIIHAVGVGRLGALSIHRQAWLASGGGTREVLELVVEVEEVALIRRGVFELVEETRGEETSSPGEPPKPNRASTGSNQEGEKNG